MTKRLRVLPGPLEKVNSIFFRVNLYSEKRLREHIRYEFLMAAKSVFNGG